MSPPTLALHTLPWPRREPPLVPRGAVAFGDAARRLAARLLEEEDEALAGLEGACAEGLIGASVGLVVPTLHQRKAVQLSASGSQVGFSGTF